MPESTDDKLNALVERVGKVRRWLAVLAVMKIAALCLIFASVYIDVYACLDRRVNFGQRGRVIALVLLIAGTAGLLGLLTRLLLKRLSCSGAANYIENRKNFNQQLVTAMEYHENKQEYPYSRALAEHLVLRVDKDCGGFRFDSTVEKWQGYVLGAIILFGLATAWFYIRDNYVYFSSYTKQLNGAQQSTFHSDADKNGSVEFDLVNEQPLANDDLPDLEVAVKTDEPPKLKLICPDGDYLTTDVASVPIKFEITDGFGLDSAKMCLEIPGRQPTELKIPIDEAIKSKEYSHTIELEKYDLTVGDSILFYAEATGIDTGSAQANRTASSEVYFIEIRPYRQNWRQRPGGGSSQGAMPAPVELLNILEYTRAILKKTWAIAGKPNFTEPDRSALNSIDNDLRYCAEQLTLIRDDSDHGYNDSQKGVLNVVLQYYEQASKYLTQYNAHSAIAPEKDAYRLLRKFVFELELQWNPPSAGAAQQPQRPDSVKLQEEPEFSQYEKERIEGELKKVQQELEKLTAEQKDLKMTFENLLKQQAEETSSAQKAANGKSSTDGGQEQGQNKRSSSQQGKASAGQESKSPSISQGGSDGEGSAKTQSGEQRQDGRQRTSANAEARLRMLQAKQRALQQQVAQLKRDLEQLPQSPESNRGQGRAEAERHLDEAVARMDDFQEKLAEARYQADMGRRDSAEALELMESARRRMDMATQALDGELTLSDEEKLAQEAQKMAEQLAEDADALDESVTPQQEQDMLALLKAAKRLLETMPEPQWAMTDQSKGTRSAAGLVLTGGSELAAAEAARQLARQFWSISIDARKRRQQLSEDEPSDVKFYGQENEFFENAAKFDAESVRE